MTDEVISFAKAKKDGKITSVEECLQNALDCVGKEGALENGDKVLIVALDTSSEQYSVNWFQAGMRMSECLALLEVAKITILQEMKYIPNDITDLMD